MRTITVDSRGNHHTKLRLAEWWDGELWWRTYTPGGYDGYRSITNRRLPCQTMADALCRPDWQDEIRRLARRPTRTTHRPAANRRRAYGDQYGRDGA